MEEEGSTLYNILTFQAEYEIQCEVSSTFPLDVASSFGKCISRRLGIIFHLPHATICWWWWCLPTGGSLSWLHVHFASCRYEQLPSSCLARCSLRLGSLFDLWQVASATILLNCRVRLPAFVCVVCGS